MTHSNVPEGLNSLRGRSLFGSTFFEPVYVLGYRRRIGTEAAWIPGPISVKAEYARSNEQRKRQGLLDDDISDFVASAWYVSGTWFITGERKISDIEPRNPLFQKGIGAIEIGTRYERISFGSALKTGTRFDNPRADPLLENPERIWTLGLNWYLNKWAKVVVNGIREAFEDPHRTAVPGKKSNWSGVLRLQFVM
jgi:phosphate-selective porin